jgi:hypothetical protein
VAEAVITAVGMVDQFSVPVAIVAMMFLAGR